MLVLVFAFRCCRFHYTNSLYLLGRQELLKLYTSTSEEEKRIQQAINSPLLSFADCRVANREVMSSFSFLSFFICFLLLPNSFFSILYDSNICCEVFGCCALSIASAPVNHESNPSRNERVWVISETIELNLQLSLS